MEVKLSNSCLANILPDDMQLILDITWLLVHFKEEIIPLLFMLWYLG